MLLILVVLLLLLWGGGFAFDLAGSAIHLLLVVALLVLILNYLPTWRDRP